MKKTIFLLAAVVISLTHYSCSKDDDNEQSKKNQFTVGSNNYELSKGILEYQGYNDYKKEYGYSIELLSSEVLFESRVNFNDDNWPSFEFTGSGHWISIEFESTIKDNITGTYTDDYALYVTDFNFSNVIEHEVNWELSEGIWSDDKIQLEIKEIGSNEYEISFSFIDDNGKSVNGYYKGTLEYFDHS